MLQVTSSIGELNLASSDNIYAFLQYITNICLCIVFINIYSCFFYLKRNLDTLCFVIKRNILVASAVCCIAMTLYWERAQTNHFYNCVNEKLLFLASLISFY